MVEESLKRSQVEEHCTVEEAQPPCEKLSCGVEHGNLLPGLWPCSNSFSWDISMVFEVWLFQLLRHWYEESDAGLIVPLTTQAHAVSLGKSEPLKDLAGPKSAECFCPMYRQHFFFFLGFERHGY